MYGHSDTQAPRGRRAAAGQRGSDRGPDVEQAILAATAALLAEVPLRELSVAQIIRGAGVSRATFYFYFGSKSAVLAALVKQAIDEIYEVTRQTRERTGSMPPSVALPARIEASAEVWDAHRPVLRAMVENWHTYPELKTVWLQMIGGLAESIASEIEHERAAGRAPAGADAHALGSMLAWTTERCLYVLGLGLPDPLANPAGTIEILAQVWASAIYGDQAGPHEAAAA